MAWRYDASRLQFGNYQNDKLTQTKPYASCGTIEGATQIARDVYGTTTYNGVNIPASLHSSYNSYNPQTKARQIDPPAFLNEFNIAQQPIPDADYNSYSSSKNLMAQRSTLVSQYASNFTSNSSGNRTQSNKYTTGGRAAAPKQVPNQVAQGTFQDAEPLFVQQQVAARSDTGTSAATAALNPNTSSQASTSPVNVPTTTDSGFVGPVQPTTNEAKAQGSPPTPKTNAKNASSVDLGGFSSGAVQALTDKINRANAAAQQQQQKDADRQKKKMQRVQQVYGRKIVVDMGDPGETLTGYPEGNVRRMLSFQIPYYVKSFGSRNNKGQLNTPELGVYLVMRINPNSIRYEYSKLLSEQRTKGGFIMQYWGENLTTINLSGITGRWGVIGIQLLMAAYRAEQYSIKQLLQGLKKDQLVNLSSGVVDLDRIQVVPSLSLGQRAATIKLHYMGWLFQGYFTNFTFNENTNQLGFFDYNVNFKVTKTFGFGNRKNIFPWQYEDIINDTQPYGGDWIFRVANAAGQDDYDDVKVVFGHV